MSNLPAVRGGTDIDPIAVGQVMAKSGFFADTRDAAQAAVKVMWGQELGIGPVTAMMGIHIIKGKLSMSANLMGAQIKRSGRYTFRVREMEHERVSIEFFEGPESLGVSSYTKQDAQTAGLWGSAGSWKQHPRNMLYARAMSNGAKWFCPDAFGGSPVYTPDELGAEVDGETGEVIELPPVDARPDPLEDPDPGVELARQRYKQLRDEHGQDALDAALAAEGLSGPDLAGSGNYDDVKVALAEAAAGAESGEVISEKDRRGLEAHAREHGLDHDALKALALEAFGVESTTLIPASQVAALRDAIAAQGAKQEAA